MDRETQRNIFRQNIGAIETEKSSQLIYYAGAGGVGKTALIRELENSIQGNYSATGLQFESVSYDFTFATEMLTVLKALKKSLTDKYQMAFPFFDIGCLSYYKKCGNESGKNEIEKILRESTFCSKCKKQIDTAIGQSYNARNVDKITGESIEALEYIAESSTFFRILKALAGFAEGCITDFQNFINENNPKYRNIMAELEKRQENFFPQAIKEYLPTLFAKDISLWLEKNKKYMVIFLDTYEQLTEDEKDVKRHEKLIYENKDVPVDWWIENLLENTERVAWVIAGRSEIKKIGETITLGKDNIFRLESLEKNFVDEFLNKSGVEDSVLREGLIQLTGGYPIFLSLCADTYKAVILKNGTPPPLKDFGEKREDVINRLLAYMDDGARNIVKRLCILGRWTDVSAMRIFSILNENNRDTYNRVKNLSFIAKQSENIFAFDRSIQKILFDHLLKNEEEFILQTRAAACEFFKSAFYKVDAEENQSITNEDRILFFKFWAEIILRTTQKAENLMEQYSDNLEPVSVYLDDTVTEDVIVQFQNKIEKTAGKENIFYAYFEHLFAQVKFSEGDITYIDNLSQIAYKKIASESNTSLKNHLPAGYYSTALFAMSANEDAAKSQTFKANFVTAVKNMPAAEKKLVIAYYGRILKTLLNTYRKSNDVIALIDKTIEFKECFGESANEFVANLLLYKLSAMNHLGKIEEFLQISKECSQAIKACGNFELNAIYTNLMVVNLQDIFDYAGSLKIGMDLLKSSNFSMYKDQYFRLCGSLALTCYLTLNNSHKNLKLARECSDAAITGFTRTFDKMRQYQIRAQIEAEVGEFETACKMLDKGLNITLENPTAEQFKNFLDYNWYWYHFAKFSERLLKSSNAKFLEVAQRAVKIARAEFLSYRNKIGDTPRHPDYITFSKFATCFDILGEIELALQLHASALRGVNADKGDDAAAFRLVMSANYLLTLERNNIADKASKLREDLKNNVAAYLTRDSMKAPFEDWRALLNQLEQNPDDKIAILEKMSRAILL